MAVGNFSFAGTRVYVTYVPKRSCFSSFTAKKKNVYSRRVAFIGFLFNKATVFTESDFNFYGIGARERKVNGMCSLSL